MRHYSALLFLLIFLAMPGVAMAGGLFGPPQSIARDTGGLHTGIGYWHHEDTYRNGAEYVIRQSQLYSEVGYGTKNSWDLYARVGMSDLNVSDAFRSTNPLTTTSKNDFEEDRNYFATVGTKFFYPFDKTFGMGAFVQGTYSFRDFTDYVTGSDRGAPFTRELRMKNLWDVNFGIAWQVTVPYGIKIYLGPYVYYAEAKASPSTNIAGLAFVSEETTMNNKTSLGGFTGLEVLLGKGFRLHMEGEYSERLSTGAAVTYSY